MKKRLGRYELIFELGSGGMAEVFLARTVGPADFHKWFAIKRVHPQMAKDQKFVDMFLDEARIAASIQHPNVAHVFDLGEDDGEYFIAMEYLHGEHLGLIATRSRKEWGHLPYEMAAHIVSKAARGLHHAHRAKSRRGETLNLVHRDVSPQNIFVTFDGQVKMTDFGIAKAAGRLTHTQTGGMKGKVAYMAPEQALGHRVDRRTDIFALGTVLWEISTGRRLFKAATDAQTLMRITADETTLPSSVRPDYPDALQKIVMHALAREPSKRYPSAHEMAEDLDAFISDSKKKTGTVEVSEMMAEILSDRFAFKERILQADPTALSSPEVVAAIRSADVQPATELEHSEPEPSVSHSKILSKSQQYALPVERNWSKPLFLLLALGVLGAGVAWWLPKGSDQATVRVETSPSGARIELDGQALDGFTPITLHELDPGRHELSIVMDGYVRLDRTFDALADETTRLEYGLSESVAVTPTSIEEPVVDNSPEGTTPESAMSGTAVPVPVTPVVMAPVAMTPVVMTPVSMTRTPESMADTPQVAAIPRTPATMRTTMRALARGSLDIRSNPWAEVRVGTRRCNNTPCVLSNLPAGQTRIHYQLRGEGPTRTKTVVVVPNTATTVVL